MMGIWAPVARKKGAPVARRGARPQEIRERRPQGRRERRPGGRLTVGGARWQHPWRAKLDGGVHGGRSSMAPWGARGGAATVLLYRSRRALPSPPEPPRPTFSAGVAAPPRVELHAGGRRRCERECERELGERAAGVGRAIPPNTELGGGTLREEVSREAEYRLALERMPSQQYLGHPNSGIEVPQCQFRIPGSNIYIQTVPMGFRQETVGHYQFTVKVDPWNLSPRKFLGTKFPYSFVGFP